MLAFAVWLQNLTLLKNWNFSCVKVKANSLSISVYILVKSVCRQIIFFSKFFCLISFSFHNDTSLNSFRLFYFINKASVFDLIRISNRTATIVLNLYTFHIYAHIHTFNNYRVYSKSGFGTSFEPFSEAHRPQHG